MSIVKLFAIALIQFATLLACSSAVSAAPCEINGLPELTLSVTAAEVRTADRTLSVQVGRDGCAVIHRPAYYKEAGDFRLQLSLTELSGLRQKVAPTLQTTDAAKLQQLLTRADTARALERTASQAAQQRFQVMDADTYTLATRSDVVNSKLTWNGLLAYAEHYPEVAELQHLSALVLALQEIAVRSDAVKVGAGP